MMPYVHIKITREVETANWGLGGLPILDYRAAQAAKETQR
jgi:phenylpyruvate tautomerase PptA (4-oxalocrotonate tautomerase family)